MQAQLFSTYRRKAVGKKGFSLVEVCLALGIIAFAVLPVLGLLSIGLNTYRNTEARDRATQVLSQIGNALCLARAVTDATGKPTGLFTAQPPYQYSATATNANSITWQWGQSGQQKQQFLIYYDDNGAITTSGSPTASIVAQVVLQPPTYQPSSSGSQLISPGWSQIVVAWPALSSPTYTDANGTKFSAAQGHVETTIPLLTTGL